MTPKLTAEVSKQITPKRVERGTMNYFRYIAIGSLLIVTSTAPAQETSSGAGGANKGEHVQRTAQNHMATVEEQLNVLTGKLDLTAEQRAKIRPVLQRMHDGTERLVRDKSLSQEERMAKATALHYQADKEIREVLSEDQKKKLDEYEQGPHPEMHGGISGAASHPQPTHDAGLTAASCIDTFAHVLGAEREPG